MPIEARATSVRGLRRGHSTASAPTRVPTRETDVLVAHAQHLRILHSAVVVVSEVGYGQMSVARVAGRAGVSRRTFYDLFEDRDDCFRAAFEDIVARLSAAVLAAYEGKRVWREQVRAALSALLSFMDDEPATRALLVVEALKAGTAVIERRAQLLEQLGRALHRGGCGAAAARELPPLTGEGVVGAVLGMLHARLLKSRPATMLEFLNPAMGMIALAYLGPAAARAELARPLPSAMPPAESRAQPEQLCPDPLADLPMRTTRRTLLVLSVIGDHPLSSNREIADLAGVSDQGQISRLLARLDGLGLAENTGDGWARGEANAWQLTSRGREVQQAIRARSSHTNRKANGTGESH